MKREITDNIWTGTAAGRDRYGGKDGMAGGKGIGDRHPLLAWPRQAFTAR